MIVLYKGSRGKGKTLTMVKDGLGYLNEGYNIIRNFQCKFGKYMDSDDILGLSKNSNVNNAVMMIDEIQIFFDNRKSMTKHNISFSYFVQQIRKRNIIILCTTQYSNTIDIRLRQHLDIIAFPNFKSNLNLCEVTYMDLTKLQDNEFMTGEAPKPMLSKVVFNAEQIFKLYDTQEMVI